jgi:hypothetical protein
VAKDAHDVHTAGRSKPAVGTRQARLLTAVGKHEGVPRREGQWLESCAIFLMHLQGVNDPRVMPQAREDRAAAQSAALAQQAGRGGSRGGPRQTISEYSRTKVPLKRE